MTKTSRYALSYRRRRSGATDYASRRRLVLSGLPRLVVRPANKHMTVQIIEADPAGDRVLASAHSSELRKYTWKGGGGNIPSAYLTGSLAGHRAKSKGIETAVLDVGTRSPTIGSRIFAAMNGAVDSGMKIPHDPKVLPPRERLRGEHISAYAKGISVEPDAFERVFSAYLRNKLKPEDVSAHFDDVREKIDSAFEGKA